MDTLALMTFVGYLFRFYEIMIFVWCILSWIPMSGEGILSDIAAAIDSLVRPYVSVFRKILPPISGLDFSPILAIVVLGLIQRLIMSILIHM